MGIINLINNIATAVAPNVGQLLQYMEANKQNKAYMAQLDQRKVIIAQLLQAVIILVPMILVAVVVRSLAGRK